MALQLLEKDLKPYQTHLIFAASKPLDPKDHATLFKQLKSLVDFNTEEDEHCRVLQTRAPRDFGDAFIGWIVYARTSPVTWAVGLEAPKDTKHHWLGLIIRKALISLVATDRAFVSKAHRAIAADKHWKGISPASRDNIEAALVHGKARTLWLSGIHRSVDTKADSKVLIGRDLDASLDALGDQTYHYTSTRCEGPKGLFTNSSVGVTPRQGKVWLGPTSYWDAFAEDAAALLAAIEATTKPRIPFAILARPKDNLAGVSEAFDASFTSPEYLGDMDNEAVAGLEMLIDDAAWTVSGTKGPNCEIEFRVHGTTFSIKVDLRMDGERVVHDAEFANPTDNEDANSVLRYCRRSDVLKLYYESVHTYSAGEVFEVTTRELPFERMDPEDFKGQGFNIALEKPLPPGETKGFDLSRIGDSKRPASSPGFKGSTRPGGCGVMMEQARWQTSSTSTRRSRHSG